MKGLVFGLRLLDFGTLCFALRLSKQRLKLNLTKAQNTKYKAQRPKSQDQRPSSLHTDNLLDLSDNFNQVFLVLHYRFN